jgi:hypothetical protein
MLTQRGLDLHDGGQNGEDCRAAYLDSATVAMGHARVAAGAGHGGGVLRHAAHWLRMTEHGSGQWPELKQEEQRRERLHHSIVALARRLDKANDRSPTLICRSEEGVRTVTPSQRGGEHGGGRPGRKA